MAQEKQHITLFLSSHQVSEAYVQPALELGRLLARANYSTIYGGSDHGLMQRVADEIQAQGGELIGVTTTVFEKHCRPGLSKTYHTATIAVRTQLMITKADAIVALSGGVGTLQEIVTALELKKLGLFTGPILILNTNHFWFHFCSQLEQMATEGFVTVPLDEMIQFCQTPAQLIASLGQALALDQTIHRTTLPIKKETHVKTISAN